MRRFEILGSDASSIAKVATEAEGRVVEAERQRSVEYFQELQDIWEKEETTVEQANDDALDEIRNLVERTYTPLEDQDGAVQKEYLEGVTLALYRLMPEILWRQQAQQEGDRVNANRTIRLERTSDHLASSEESFYGALVIAARVTGQTYRTLIPGIHPEDSVNAFVGPESDPLELKGKYEAFHERRREAQIRWEERYGRDSHLD